MEKQNNAHNLSSQGHMVHGQVGRIIMSQSCLEEGMNALSSQCPTLKRAYAQTGPLPLRLRKEGFSALLRAIVGQQVSVASAQAIWKRLEVARLTGPLKIKAASDEALRACGLSRQKIRYARALSESGIKYKTLRDLPTQDVIDRLIVVPGVGRWTAEIYAMFSLGRADVFAPNDLALQEATRMLFELDKRPTEKELRIFAQKWSPWQSVAARLLWAYFHIAKKREGI